MVIIIKLKHAASAQQAQPLSVDSLNVFLALMDAQVALLKIIRHLISHVLAAFLIMATPMVLAHYALQIKLLKVDKPFVQIVQVDAISAMVPFAHHAKITISYLTILVKLALTALSQSEETLLNVLPAATIV